MFDTGNILRRGRDQITTFSERPAVKRSIAGLQLIIFVLIVAWLVWRLSGIGWRNVMSGLPASPWFYAFFALRFVALPLSEAAIYEVIWDRPLARHFPAFLRKRVFNTAVAGYSGEAFFSFWARRTLGISDGAVLRGVKDNNILSALISNSATVAIIALLYGNGILGAGVDALPPGAGSLIGLAFAIALILSLAVLAFRNRLLSLPPDKLRRVAGLHIVRTAVIMALHAAMYAAALPASPISAWLLFIAVQLVISRIPFMPNQDLVFLGVALTMAPVANAPEAAIAGMLVAESALGHVVNLTLFLATSYLARGAKAG